MFGLEVGWFMVLIIRLWIWFVLLVLCFDWYVCCLFTLTLITGLVLLIVLCFDWLVCLFCCFSGYLGCLVVCLILLVWLWWLFCLDLCWFVSYLGITCRLFDCLLICLILRVCWFGHCDFGWNLFCDWFGFVSLFVVAFSVIRFCFAVVYFNLVFEWGCCYSCFVVWVWLVGCLVCGFASYVCFVSLVWVWCLWCCLWVFLFMLFSYLLGVIVCFCLDVWCVTLEFD